MRTKTQLIYQIKEVLGCEVIKTKDNLVTIKCPDDNTQYMLDLNLKKLGIYKIKKIFDNIYQYNFNRLIY